LHEHLFFENKYIVLQGIVLIKAWEDVYSDL